jgi:hypothetical protein
MSSVLEKSILRTLAWFSVLEYPATTFETWKWLHAPGESYSLAQVDSCLRSSSVIAERIEAQRIETSQERTLAEMGGAARAER